MSSSSTGQAEKRNIIAVIGDEDTTTGLLLAGVGQIAPNQTAEQDDSVAQDRSNTDTKHKNEDIGDNMGKNFFVYREGKTTKQELEEIFQLFTQKRKDISLLLINQFVADKIRHSVDSYTNAFPAILEIPSKDHPYNPEKDSVLKRVKKLFGE
ncbi:probable V-type proton ATPase subunit F [Saccharomycodes ludwigii]|uniref:V-type proton ATPase subunit F n=1 Tax=Saccharomycodes ludwigii TaxID=36035 RepID=A0A376B1R0_9ASCO|nr:hypothetical protein SCDLUD_001438 [Saccharomycodes ludwigii]KAH3901668.1 hypothetical protein SCDLUD_001438 [Saccharomycodes ludwigii]SSD58559.1 probable V-type proton ATPase subunit F [Saccharomycodes ludwigii]